MNLKKLFSIILILSLFGCASIEDMNKNILYLNGMKIDKAISMLEIGQPTNYIELENSKIYIWESLQNISVPIGGYNQGSGYGPDGTVVSVSTWDPNKSSTNMSFKCKITIYTTNKYKITNSLVEGDSAQCNVFDKKIEEAAQYIIKVNNIIKANNASLREGYFENGQLRYRNTYEEGKQDWLRETYYESGQLKSERNYQDNELNLLQTFTPEGKLIFSQTFTPDGKPLADLSYTNDMKTGVEHSYHDNGQLKSKENYKDGKLNGALKTYYENGQLQSERNYQDDELNLLQTFTPEGKLNFFQTFTPDGKPLADLSYTKNMKTGVEHSYHVNGQLKSKENYKDGKLDGLEESYYRDGRLGSKECYINGRKAGMSYCEK
jgi:antitoxin component YwqK of YwqJK toxin-antitoxin module